MEEFKPGCGVTPPTSAEGQTSEDGPRDAAETKEEPPMSILVGQQAPDFEAPGFQNGEFGKFKLSDYRGKWVVLCFYPGDFTFV